MYKTKRDWRFENLNLFLTRWNKTGKENVGQPVAVMTGKQLAGWKKKGKIWLEADFYLCILNLCFAQAISICNSVKRQRLSTHCEYFQSELAHIIAMCDARIPYITLCEEVSSDSIINLKINSKIRLRAKPAEMSTNFK